MATVIGLGVQFTANANGMTKGLSQADRALQNLAKQASKAAALFDGFTSSSAAAAAAQQKVATDLAFLNSAFRTGQVSAEQYVAELKTITGEATAASQAFAEGARVTAQVQTAEEKRTATLDRLSQLLQQGAISQQTFDRAAADASGANAEAAAAESARAQALQRAAQITQANLSPQQRYDQEVLELSQHLAAGRISQDTYNSALNKAAQSYAQATVAAARYDAAADNAGTGNTLAFNELSGILSALPGPIGNVAGRLSGLASAGEGLGRVFSGGLSQGFAALGRSVTSFINPFTAGVAAVAGFGAAAVALGRSLGELDDRVERLGNAADKLGVSFEFIQVLEESARRSGVSFEQVNSATTRLLKTLAGADEESKAATAALGRLGLSLDDLSSLSPEEQFRAIGDALTGIEDPAKRVAAATALFGKSGAELLPFFNNLDKAASDIDRFGRALNNVDRRRVDEFGDSVDALGVATRQLGTEVTLPFVGLGEGINQAAAEFLGGVNAIVGPIGDVLEPALSALGTAFETIGVAVGTVGRIIGAVLEPVGTIFQSLSESFEPFLNGVTDAVRFLGDAAVSATEFVVSFTPLGAIADNIGAIGETLGRVITIIGTAVAKAGEYVGSLVASFVEFTGLSDAIESIGNILSSVFGSVAATFGTIASAIGGTVGRLLEIAEGFLGIDRSARAAAESSVAAVEVEAAPEGFNDFARAIDSSRTALNAAINEASQFGEAGFAAAFEFQQALADLQQQAEDGILNETAYKAEVDRATAAYRSQIDTIKEAAQAEEQKAEAARRAADAAVEADRRRADAALERQRVDDEFGGDNQRAEAAENVLAIEREILRAEQELNAAREAGDQAAADRAAARLAQLDQVAQRERDIASGAAQERERAEQEAQKAADERKRKELDAIEEAAKKEEDRRKRVADLEEQYQERFAELQRDRLDSLSRASNEALQGNDLRTSAGISQFLALATGREDPAVAEYRKQLKELQDIRREIAKVGAAPVEIVGA